MTFRCWAEINHDALRHNAKAIQHSIGEQSGILAVIKANGYGHGGPEVAQTLSAFAAQLGVATLGEARAVRAAVPHKDILLLSPCLPSERKEAVDEGFIPVVSSTAEARAYARWAQEQRPVRLHLCLDTGMGRIGVWQDDALAAAMEMAALANIAVDSVSTHLPVVDSDPDFTAQELETWSQLVRQLRPILPRTKFHALNSAASLEHPQYAADLVRPGLALYGIAPLPGFQELLRPAMTLKTRITLLRDVGPGRGVSYGRDFLTTRPTRVATLAVGYADGYPRQTSGRGAQVLVRGRRCPILGRITMDQLMADVTALPRDVAPGEEVVLFGRQEESEIPAGDVASWAGTIPWDILTRLGPRVGRVHLETPGRPALES